MQITRSSSPLYLDTLAAAYAEVGRYSDAVATEERALELARHENQTGLIEALEAHKQLYKAQQPYREAIDASQ